jgi:hypothetical protein
MKASDIKVLTSEGLAERKLFLQRSLEHVVLFDKLARNPEGQLLIEDLKLRLKSIKNMYSSIPPASPSASHLLAGFQSAQYEVEEIVNMLESVNVYIEQYTHEIKEIDKEFKVRIDAIRKSEDVGSFLPSGYKRRKKK